MPKEANSSRLAGWLGGWVVGWLALGLLLISCSVAVRRFLPSAASRLTRLKLAERARATSSGLVLFSRAARQLPERPRHSGLRESKAQSQESMMSLRQCSSEVTKLM